MIDSIRLLIESDFTIRDDFERIEKLLESKKITTNEDGRRTMSGRIRNLKVYMYSSGLIIDGSLTKFYYGTNQFSLNRKTINNAISELEGLIGFDLYQAKVLRVDIGENLILKNPVKDYFDLLGYVSRYERLEFPNGVGYSTRKKHISFYDKVKEVKKAKETLCSLFTEHYVLRYEYKLLSQSVIADLLKLKTVKLYDVISNFDKFIMAWGNAFSKIIKNNPSIPIKAEILNVKGGLEDYVKFRGLEVIGGLTAVLKFIKSAKKQGYLNKYPNEGTNLLNKFKSLTLDQNLFTPSRLVDELEKKIKIIKFYSTEKLLQ
jgi:hypothetical protein